MLGLIGLFASLARKQFLLPAWMLILYLIEPRSGTLYAMLPLALLIGFALDSVILPSLRPKRDIEISGNSNPLGGKISQYFLLFLFAYCALSAYSISLKIKEDMSLQPTDLAAFSWVRENTSIDANFLLVTEQLPLRDAWSEWFPVLTERHSQATVFGYEWVNDGHFENRLEVYKNLQACAYESVDCLDNWHQGIMGDHSYVYLWNPNGALHYPLSVYLQRNPDYDLVFQNKQTLIFTKNR
jgi:hypothetical protein